LFSAIINFKNLSIKNKILAVYVPLLLMPLITIGYFAVHISTQSIIDKTIKNIHDNSGLIITRIDGMLTNTESCANITAVNLSKAFLDTRGVPHNQINDLEFGRQIRTILNNALIIFPDVESLAFINLNNEVFATDYRLENNTDNIAHSYLLAQIDQGSGGQNLWFAMDKRNILTTDRNNLVLTLGKQVIDIDSGKELGRLILNVREDTFSNIYQNMGPLKQGSYFIVDNKEIVISSANQGELLKPIPNQTLKWWIHNSSKSSLITSLNGKNTLITKSPFPDLGWMLVSRASVWELTAESRKISFIIILVTIICLAVALSGAGLLSKVIASPLIKLTKVMSEVKKENMEVFFKATTTDEIGLLAEGFNKMFDRIRELLSRVQQEQRQKREYELALIQAQIKPHFLYNSLDVIFTLSEMGRAAEVQKTAKALADFYRVALSKGKEEITIAEEIKNVRAYLQIQQIRYSDVFDFTIDINPEIMDDIILKLTIQPLVENAIYHGLKPKGSFGRIRIEGFRAEDQIVVIIGDNGIGIPREKLLNLLVDPGGNGLNSGFGLVNVDKRLKLYFGELYGLNIHSEPGKGTEVKVRIPVRQGGIFDAEINGGG
jgi:Predicted signal transduction protein with a C-terminal ATPase domain